MGYKNWRDSDPTTSELAGRYAANFAHSHCAIIYDTMLKLGRPVAVEEIEDNCSLDKQQINKRTPELRDRYKLIEQMPDLPENYHRNRTGRWALKWRVLPREAVS